MSYDLLLYDKYHDGLNTIGNIKEIARNWRRSIRAFGGYWLGSFLLSSDDLSKVELLDWYQERLGYEVVEETYKQMTWQGLILEMDLTLDGKKYRRTLDPTKFFNSVAVDYEDSGIPVRTAAANSTASQALYGQVDHLHTIGEATSAQAIALRDTLLNKHCWPRSRATGDLECGRERRKKKDSVTVTVGGYVHTINWRYTEAVIAATAASTVLTTTVGLSEFVTAGSIDTNALSVDLDASSGMWRWDIMEEIVRLGDVMGAIWVGGVFQDRKFDYNAANTTVTHYLFGRILKETNHHCPHLTQVVPDIIVHNPNAPVDDSPTGGTVLDDPRNEWIEEVEFVSPDTLRLKPEGFADVEVLLGPDIRKKEYG